MLKLIKYEVLESYREYLMIFVIFFVGCIILPVLPMSMLDIAGSILAIALVTIIISIGCNIIISFNSSMFKKSGYLTLTLPVTTTQLIISKIIGAIIWTMITSFVFFIGMILLSFSISDSEINFKINDITSLFTLLFLNIDIVLKLLFNSLVSLTCFISSLYLVITFVHTKYIPKYKGVIGVILYAIMVFGITSFFSLDSITNFMYNLNDTGLYILEQIVFIVLALISIVGTIYLIDNKIEIE